LTIRVGGDPETDILETGVEAPGRLRSQTDNPLDVESDTNTDANADTDLFDDSSRFGESESDGGAGQAGVTRGRNRRDVQGEPEGVGREFDASRGAFAGGVFSGLGGSAKRGVGDRGVGGARPTAFDVASRGFESGVASEMNAESVEEPFARLAEDTGAFSGGDTRSGVDTDFGVAMDSDTDLALSQELDTRQKLDTDTRPRARGNGSSPEFEESTRVDSRERFGLDTEDDVFSSGIASAEDLEDDWG
jgi:hypothetical protein